MKNSIIKSVALVETAPKKAKKKVYIEYDSVKNKNARYIMVVKKKFALKNKEY